MASIFISYRREDTAGYAGRLAERLESRFGRDQVFIDIDAIPAGVDFEERIHQTLTRATITLVLIGEKWLERRADGSRRIDDEGDYVRQEVAAALGRTDSTVIPVLIERTEMPAAAELPEELAPLAKRNAIRLANEHWRYDVEQLARRVDELSATGRVARGLRLARARVGVALAAAAVLAVAVVAVLLASSGGGAAAANVRVDDVPVANPLAKYQSLGNLKPDIQVEATKPWIELKIHNLGTQLADVTRARITVVDALEIKPCFSAGGAPLSATYDTVLPTTVGGSVDQVVNEQVPAGQVDRFRITFDLPLAAYGPGGLDSWLMRLHVQLLHDAQSTPVDAGYVVLAFSGAPDPRDFARWWTKGAAANPGYATLVKSWGASSMQCVIHQTPTIQRFLALSGRRSPELTAFAAELTTQT